MEPKQKGCIPVSTKMELEFAIPILSVSISTLRLE